jgi:hypothetical protein
MGRSQRGPGGFRLAQWAEVVGATGARSSPADATAAN